MTFADIYQREGKDYLMRMAAATGASPDYLRQIAYRWRGKRPSPELAQAMVDADPRLDFRQLLLPDDAA